MSRVFISYKRADKEKVFPLKDKIEAAIGEPCWIDLDGIESDAQFVNVIMQAIDDAEIFLFMYSKEHSCITDFEKDWTVRELNYARQKGKTIIFVDIDEVPLPKWFLENFGQLRRIKYTEIIHQCLRFNDIDDILKFAGECINQVSYISNERRSYRKCINGHYYPAIYSDCPYCPPAKKANYTTPYEEPYCDETCSSNVMSIMSPTENFASFAEADNSDTNDHTCIYDDTNNYEKENVTYVPHVKPNPSMDIVGASVGLPSLFYLFSSITGLFTTLDQMIPFSQKESHRIYSSIFAPAEIRRKTHMLVQVYLHSEIETELVKKLAKESQQTAERRDYIPLQCQLKKGDKVDILLYIHGETLLYSDKKSIIWQGSFTKCSFDYFVPQDIDATELSCKVILTINNIPIGDMQFITSIVYDAPRQLNPEIIAHNYNKVFISYAHQDESKVKFLAEGFKISNTDYFFDRHYLKAGDIYPIKIQEYINSADLFILCWSKNASQSEYVAKELAQALERAYPNLLFDKNRPLTIYPMSIAPKTDLPANMKETYNFIEL